jgi:tRNA A37 threonylcarbamoyladenosine dehydratase
MAVLNSSILRSIITFLLGSLASVLLQRSFALLPAPAKEEEEEKKEEEEEEKTRQLPDFMVDEYFSRMRSFLGDDNFGSLRNSFVVVVGLGGVGSHTVNILARSGIKRIRIIDLDQVTLSTLSRHAVATMADVGRPKADVIKAHLAEICPQVEVESIVRVFDKESGEALIEGADFVVDCIDDSSTKAHLLSLCYQRNIPHISAMGAGGKSDPTKIRIGTLVESASDPLATKIKHILRREYTELDIDFEKIICCFSCQKVVANLLPLTDEQAEHPEQFGALDKFRLRVIPVMGTTPALFGYSMAAFAISVLGRTPFQPTAIVRISRSVRNKILQRWRKRELDMELFKRQSLEGEQKASEEVVEEANEAVKQSCTMGDCEAIADEIWRGRCAVTGVRLLEGKRAFSITRLDWQKESAPSNLLLVVDSVAEELEEAFRRGQGPESVVDEGTLASIRSRLALYEV